MDKYAKNMDISDTNHIKSPSLYVKTGDLPRLFRIAHRVEHVGYNSAMFYNKRNVTHNNTVNVAVILSSKETFFTRRVDGRYEKLRPPLVGLSGPGHSYDYLSSDEWEEFYFCLDKKELSYWKNMGLYVDTPAIELSQASPILRLVYQIIEKARNIQELGEVDRLDRLCEMLIFEIALLKNLSIKRSSHEEDIRSIASYLRKHCEENIEWNKLLFKYGMTKRTFQRQWKKLFPITPNAYVIKLKMDIARSLLRETRLQISEIASKLNYDDSLYFSRLFKKETGFSPRNYRDQLQRELELEHPIKTINAKLKIY